jgi:hypothetical protein
MWTYRPTSSVVERVRKLPGVCPRERGIWGEDWQSCNRSCRARVNDPTTSASIAGIARQPLPVSILLLSHPLLGLLPVAALKGGLLIILINRCIHVSASFPVKLAASAAEVRRTASPASRRVSSRFFSSVFRPASTNFRSQIVKGMIIFETNSRAA